MTLQDFLIEEKHVRANHAIFDYQGSIVIKLRSSKNFKIRNSTRIFYSKNQDLSEKSGFKKRTSEDLQRLFRSSLKLPKSSTNIRNRRALIPFPIFGLKLLVWVTLRIGFCRNRLCLELIVKNVEIILLN